MINAIINGFFYVVQALIAVVLAPIDLLLQNIPALNDVATAVSSLNTTLYNVTRYFVGINGILNTNLRAAFIGGITAWLFFANSQRAVAMIKLAYKWLQKIKFW